MIELANPGYLALIGHRPVIGRTVAEALPDAAAQGYLALLDEVYRTGKPYSAASAKYMAQTSPDAPVDERYVDFVYQPITDPDGSVGGILVQGVDVTARAATDRALAMNRARLDYATRLSGGFRTATPFDRARAGTIESKQHFFLADGPITIDELLREDSRRGPLPTRTRSTRRSAPGLRMTSSTVPPASDDRSDQVDPRA